MSDNSKKIAVVMLNLGGPDSKEAIEPFLMNFFMDKNIIRLPLPLRYALAKLISTRRSKREAGDSYGEIGGKSPLLDNTQAQALALENALAKDGVEYKSFVCMRYWHPMSAQVVKDVQEWGADEIVLLPLYPQFSTTTTYSSLETWEKEMQAAEFVCSTSTICCYPVNEGFVKASAMNITLEYKKALSDGYEAPRILFSAHGLPESVIAAGDPYQQQCEQSVEAIVDVLAHMLGVERSALEYQSCYQSRVGRQKWISPSTKEALTSAAQDGKAVVIYPHSFTQEHVETLVELDIEHKNMALEMGLEGYYRAQTVGMHSDFIASLAQMVRECVSSDDDVQAQEFEECYPALFDLYNGPTKKAA